MKTQPNPFGIIYSDGGYYQSTSYNELPALGLNNVGLERIIFQNSTISRDFGGLICDDEEFRQKLLQHCNEINFIFKKCAHSALFRINRCIIKDEIIYLESNCEYKAFYPSLRENEILHANGATSSLASKLRTKKISSNNRVCYYLGSIGCANYGHWLVDALPKIKAIIDNASPAEIIIQSYGRIDRIKKESLKYFCKNIDIRIKFISKGEAIECENINYVSPISYHPYLKNTNAIKYLREQFFEREKEKSSPYERLFILRHRKYKRQIANLKQVLPILKRHNFKIIDPENFDFCKQASLFKGAKIIVGTMGAAMCNTVFSPNAAKLLYLTPNQWIEPFYWDLAASIGHDYNVIYGKRCNFETSVHLDDFSIDELVFEKEIERLIG